MAGDLEDLVLTVSADTRQVMRALNRLQGDTNKTTKQIERQFNTMGDRVGRSFAGIGRGLAASLAGAFSLRGAQQLIDTATRIENALKVAGLAGEELTAVYDRLYASAQKNAAPIESLVTLYGRAALVQRELGVSTEELLTFTNNVALALRVAGTNAQSASGALLQLSQALGSGTVRAEEFNSILEGAPTIAQAAAAGLEEAGGSVSRLRQLVIDGQVSSEAFFRAFEAGASTLETRVAGATLTTSQALTQLENSLIDAARRFDEVAGASEAAAGLLQQLASVVEGLSAVFEAAANGPIGTFIGRLSQLNDLIRQVLPGFNALGLVSGDSLNDLAGFIEGTVNGNSAGPTTVTTTGGRTGRIGSDRIQSRIDSAFGTLPPQQRTVSLRDFAPPVARASGGGGGGGGGGAAKAAEDLRKARDAAREFEKAERDAERAAESMGQAVGGAVRSLVDAFADGKLEAEELLSIVGDLIQQLLRASSIGGGGGGGFLAGILSSIFHKGGVVGGAADQRMVSPSTFAGARRMHSGGIAGLRSDEVPAILQRGEVVLPRGAKAGGSETIRVVLQDDSGRMADIADQQIQTRAGTIIQVSVQQSQKAVKANMPSYIADAQARNF